MMDFRQFAVDNARREFGADNLSDSTVLSLAQKAQHFGLLIVIDFRGRAKLRRALRPGDQKIGVAIKPAKAA